MIDFFFLMQILRFISFSSEKYYFSKIKIYLYANAYKMESIKELKKKKIKTANLGCNRTKLQFNERIVEPDRGSWRL